QPWLSALGPTREHSMTAIGAPCKLHQLPSELPTTIAERCADEQLLLGQFRCAARGAMLFYARSLSSSSSFASAACAGREQLQLAARRRPEVWWRGWSRTRLFVSHGRRRQALLVPLDSGCTSTVISVPPFAPPPIA